VAELTKQSQSNVKINNLRLCLQAVIENEPVSRADVVRITHISKPTVSKLIDELIDNRILSEIGTGDSRGGRKPILLKFNRVKKLFLAIKMGRASFHIAIADCKGNILKSFEQEFPANMSSQTKLQHIKDQAVSLIKKSNLTIDRFLKIIIIAPGIYPGPKSGTKLIWSYEDLTENDIKEVFGTIFHQGITLYHTTKLSLLGEYIDGKAKGYKNVLFIDFSYGLGSSLLIDEKLYFGSDNSSGEIGYFYSSLEEFENNKVEPFQMGSLENKISGKAIREKALEAIRENPHSKILAHAENEVQNISARTVFAAAKDGDQTALVLLRESFRYFNMALANMINFFDPELIILGGGFSRCGEYLLDFVQDQIRGKILTNPKFEVSSLKQKASIIGSIHYLIQHTDFLTEL
jgi:glucokinase